METKPEKTNSNYADHNLIVSLVAEGSRVLDLGCGQGKLLKLLVERKKVRGSGVDIDQENVITCVEKGLTVFQSDLDVGLADHPAQSYDYVILNQTIQVVHRPHVLMQEMLRVGKKAIIGFPNFGNLNLIFYLLFKGKMPKSKTLPYEWYDTPNIHLLTIKDFIVYCRQNRINIDQELFIRNGKPFPRSWPCRWLANYLVDEAIFVISSQGT